MSVTTKPGRAAAPPPPRARQGDAAPPSVRGCRCSAPIAGIQAQLIDDVKGHTVAAVNWTEDELKRLGAWSRPSARAS